ncbi:hypothetical protein DBR42_29980 [Pelomonas sp. HMWF004]|nr:hypothetical protein DBR42_29980 [Pelomonas sp. HMWF004]
MSEFTFSQAQADMRSGYLCGVPGIWASGAVWLVAAAVAVQVSHPAGVLALLAGGMVIHPLGVVLAKLLGRTGGHTAGNPLGRLAAEGTFWLLAGIAIAYGMQVLRLEWFFPAMLLLIGGRYLTFQTLYGLKAYWVLGGVLCGVGLVLALARVPAPVAAFAGGLIEVLFAALLFRRAKRDVANPATLAR